MLGKDPRSFRNSFAWWESLTFKPKLSDAGSSSESHLRTGISLMQPGSCCVLWDGALLSEMGCGKGTTSDILQLYWNYIWSDQIWDTVSSLQDPLPVDFLHYLMAVDNIRLNATVGAAHDWLTAPSALNCSQAQGTTATAQHTDEIMS